MTFSSFGDWWDRVGRWQKATTVDRWRRKDGRFARLCEMALDKASSKIELLAWERGVTGIEEPVYHYGKFSHMRIKRSDAIFRMLLIASNPKKYGRMGAVAARKPEAQPDAGIAPEQHEEDAEAAREEILRMRRNRTP